MMLRSSVQSKLLRLVLNKNGNESVLVVGHARLCSSNLASTPTADNPQQLAPLMDLMGRRHNYLRISLTERCNLRCKYCMPAEGVPLTARARLLTADETLRLARVFATLGVDKLRLTGGEPTLRKDLADIVQGLTAIPGIKSVSMTTNGLVLTRRLPALQRAGLAALNVSLDSLQPERYERMARRPGLPRVLAGIDLALQLGYRPVKINTVLMKGFNEDEILDFVEYTRDREVEVHRVHAVRRQRVGAGPACAVPRRAAPRAAPPSRPGARRAAAQRHCPGVAGAGVRGPRGLHRVHDAGVLLLLQPAAAHRRREPQGVPAGRGGGVAAGRAACGRERRGRRAASARRAAQQAIAARGHGQPRAAPQQAHDPHRRLAALGVRRYCTAAGGRGEGDHRLESEDPDGLTHLDGEGRARMVDVGDKPVTRREAVAECRLQAGARLLRALRRAELRKGDALSAAQLAGVLAAKRTADLIPLCHALPLDCVRVSVQLPRGEAGALSVRCSVRTRARTGAEMEALVGAALAALTLYDMGKAVDKRMRITDLRLLHKSGGRSDWPAEADSPRED
ncbi:molybdenum cofactor biosynthesis protein 1 isoform X2 [Plodia interpunctella]|uniref:molybdenum cofactor biosynthesis protein 1 isoform X2 n=1 Tax=Plodia interpunctella TaxID=58824 RepID=UPI002368DFA2|nr:molybdenum cofactor biosynthesis protein 1 isoform X2 [Plodia interpunctella]